MKLWNLYQRKELNKVHSVHLGCVIDENQKAALSLASLPA